MNEKEIKKWQKRNQAFRCEQMNALITEHACRQNQKQARKYARNRYQSGWGATGRGHGSVTAYMHCSHCPKCTLKYKPDFRLKQSTAACVADEPDFWNIFAGEL